MIRSQRYKEHLGRLSPEELSAKISEYDFPDPYQKIAEVGSKIIDFCQNYEPKIQHNKKIFTIEARLYAYLQIVGGDNSLLVPKLREELTRLKNLYIEIILPRELNGEMINCVLDVIRAKKLENIDDILKIDRKNLLVSEQTTRQELITFGNYVNRCVEFLNVQGKEGDFLSMNGDDIIRTAYMEKSNNFHCWRCGGKIKFDKKYKSENNDIVYINEWDHYFMIGISVKHLVECLNNQSCGCSSYDTRELRRIF